MLSSTPEAAAHAESALAEVLRLKREYLLPCVYHFYRQPPLIVAAEGCELIDASGRRYLDMYSGVTVVNAGHCNAEIQAATIAQMQRLDHTTSIYLSEPVVRLAERLARILPGDLRRSFFCTSGSEANEGALLLAALHTGRSEFVALRSGLHGRTKAAMSATGLEMWRTDPFPLSAMHLAPSADAPHALPELERLLGEIGPQRVAAIIAEPIAGNGGITIPPAEYWPRVRGLCDQHGILLIFDEVQTGMNRTGRWWACEHWNVTPDILTTAKALANGYPIAAFATTDKIAASYTRPGASTFGGNPVGAATAVATIDFHERNDLAGKSRERGAQLLRGLEVLAEKHGELTQPRGRGLMVAVDVVDQSGAASAGRMDDLLEELKDRGVLCGKTGVARNVLTLLPPLTISAAQIDCFLAILADALKAQRGK